MNSSDSAPVLMEMCYLLSKVLSTFAHLAVGRLALQFFFFHSQQVSVCTTNTHHLK